MSARLAGEDDAAVLGPGHLVGRVVGVAVVSWTQQPAVGQVGGAALAPGVVVVGVAEPGRPVAAEGGAGLVAQVRVLWRSIFRILFPGPVTEVSRRRWRASSTTVARWLRSEERASRNHHQERTVSRVPAAPPGVPPSVAAPFRPRPRRPGGFETALARLLNHRRSVVEERGTSVSKPPPGADREPGAGRAPRRTTLRRRALQTATPTTPEVSRRRWRASSTTVDPGGRAGEARAGSRPRTRSRTSWSRRARWRFSSRARCGSAPNAACRTTCGRSG